MADALFRVIEDGYRVTFPDYQMEFAVERLRWERDELFGHLTVACGLAGARTNDGLLSAFTFNFSSQRTRRDQGNYLARRANIRTPDMLIDMLEDVCHRVLTAERRGMPSIVLRDVPRPDPDDEFDIDGFRFPKHHPTIVFGDGGTLKSLLTLRTAGLLAAHHHTLFCDWEFEAAAHRLRLEQMFGSAMPAVRYVRCDRPLVHEIDRLRKIVRDESIEFACFDSIGYACPGPPENAEHATSYFRAVRQLGIGSLHVAHIRQGDDNDRKPFGSAFWHNSARSTWFVKLAATSPDGQRLTIGLFNRKSNLSALRAAVGFEVLFDNGRILFDRVNVATVTELAESLPLWQRMKSALRSGPLTLARLAEDLGSTVDTLDRTVRRKTTLFARVSSEDGITRIALVERRAS